MEQKDPFPLDEYAGMLAHVCKRPCMYTRNGSFSEVLAFLCGYDHARGLTIGMGCIWGELYRFGEWLRRRCGYREYSSWHLVLLRHCENDDQRALEQLWPLFEEFLSSPPFDPWDDVEDVG
jgi:hypothetical protein